MNELLAASLEFPTVVFTIVLGIVLVYWLFVLLGALDIDLFGGDVCRGPRLVRLASRAATCAS